MTGLSGALRQCHCSTWLDVVKVLEGLVCYWSDLDGIHIQPAPSSCPVASHLWAYDSKHQWVRVRIENDRFVVVALTGAESAPETPNQTQVSYVRQPQRAWQSKDLRVQQAKLNDVPESIEVVEVVGLSPLTFLSVPRA
jgi:hypothetical protein